MKKTNEDFQKEILEKNQKIIVLGEYNGIKEKILVQCKQCGEQYYAWPNNLLKGHGCRRCADTKNSNNYTMTDEEFKQRVNKLNPNLFVRGTYTKSNVPIECECLICGNVFYPRPANLLFRNGSCPRCSRKALRKTQEEFIEDVYKLNPHVKIIGKYNNNATSVDCECLKCGTHWSPKATWLLQGKGCPTCNMSKGERKIESFLLSHNIAFQKQYTYDDCKDKAKLPFDFFLPDFNLVIEYDGKQHFQEVEDWFNSTLEEIQEHDKIKNEYCANHDINILRISYKDYKKIEDILKNQLLIYS